MALNVTYEFNSGGFLSHINGTPIEDYPRGVAFDQAPKHVRKYVPGTARKILIDKLFIEYNEEAGKPFSVPEEAELF